VFVVTNSLRLRRFHAASTTDHAAAHAADRARTGPIPTGSTR